MTSPTDNPIEIEPPGAANAAVIWLHGLGADGHDFEPLVPELGLVERGVRFVLPHAPFIPVTINGGMRMPAWYDIRWPDLARDVDEAGIRASVGYLRSLIDREVERGIPPKRVVLAGFSQGGAIALHTGLTDLRRLGGVLALSTYLPLPDALEAELSPAARDLHLLFCHGTEDPIAPLALAEASRQRLEALGLAPEFRTYPMGHAVCGPEIEDIRRWLYVRLCPNEQDGNSGQAGPDA